MIMADSTNNPTAPSSIQNSRRSDWPMAAVAIVAVVAGAAVAITSMVTSSWKNNAVQCCNPCAQATPPIQPRFLMKGNDKIPMDCNGELCWPATDNPQNRGVQAPGDQKPGKLLPGDQKQPPSDHPTLPAGPRPEQGSPGILPSTQPRAPESQPRPVENTVRPKLRTHRPHRHGRHFYHVRHHARPHVCQ
jgi:hypothetical protein